MMEASVFANTVTVVHVLLQIQLPIAVTKNVGPRQKIYAVMYKTFMEHALVGISLSVLRRMLSMLKVTH